MSGIDSVIRKLEMTIRRQEAALQESKTQLAALQDIKKQEFAGTPKAK